MTVDIQTQKTKLESELQSITEQLKDLGIHNPEVKEDWIPIPEDVGTSEADPNIVADRSEDWQERRGTLDALETRYNNLNRALEKIKTETYGQCELCDEPIEADRLEANPAARTCKTHINQESDLVN
jgi:DnaK suppressor protein